jgi:REP element-mobilizing transposase RayT
VRPYEEFCEVRIITYCVMSNHLHVFVEVLQRPAQVPDDTEPLAKLKRLCSPEAFAQIRLQRENPRSLGAIPEALRGSFSGGCGSYAPSETLSLA